MEICRKEKKFSWEAILWPVWSESGLWGAIFFDSIWSIYGLKDDLLVANILTTLFNLLGHSHF